MQDRSLLETRNSEEHGSPFCANKQRRNDTEELVTLLAVRVHDTLLDLVKEERNSTPAFGPTFVYVSGKRSVGRSRFLGERSR